MAEESKTNMCWIQPEIIKDENGEDITVSNLKVIKLLQSLWSRGYVKKTYSWLLAM